MVRLFARVVLAVLTAAALLVLASRPAGAAGAPGPVGWKVSNPQYRYYNSPDDIIGTYGQARARRWASDGYAQVKAWLWGQYDLATGRTQHFDIRCVAWSRQQFKLDLELGHGPYPGGPPPRPTSCPQQAWAEAWLCHDFDEEETVIGIFNIETRELVGNLADKCWPYNLSAPPPVYSKQSHGCFTDWSPDRHPQPESTLVTSTTPILNMPIDDWHTMNWVKAFAEGWIAGDDGLVVADCSACMSGSATVTYWHP